MCLVACLTRFAGTVALHGHGQDDRGTLGLLTSGRVGCVHFVRVVTASIEVHDVVIAQIFYEIQSFRVLPKEVFTGVSAPVKFAILKLPITDFVHTLEQHP